MSSPELSVAARDFDAAGKPYHFALRPAWIRGALEGTDVAAPEHDGAFDVRLSKSGNDVVVRGTLSVELVLPCARCLEPARIMIHETVSALFVPSGVLRAEAPGRGKSKSRGDDDEVTGTADSPDVVAYDGESVVMDGLVRDEMLLALPIVPLCSEACEGIRLTQT